ncbi:hypothetical protein An04g02180, partial [Aspergillus niger]|uniref:Uncharacterized protein n=2 Tax=Aspergillus niger TaxID=5061 RepID=A0AAJ8C1K0_ASPNG
MAKNHDAVVVRPLRHRDPTMPCDDLANSSDEDRDPLLDELDTHMLPSSASNGLRTLNLPGASIVAVSGHPQPDSYYFYQVDMPWKARSYDYCNYPVRVHTREIRRTIFSAVWENLPAQAKPVAKGLLPGISGQCSIKLRHTYAPTSRGLHFDDAVLLLRALLQKLGGEKGGFACSGEGGKSTKRAAGKRIKRRPEEAIVRWPPVETVTNAQLGSADWLPPQLPLLASIDPCLALADQLPRRFVFSFSRASRSVFTHADLGAFLRPFFLS